MKNTLIRLIALMMAMCMIVCCVGCSEGEEDVEIVYQYEDGTVPTEDGTTQTQQQGDAATQTDNNKNSATSSTNSTTSNSKKPTSKVEKVINDNVDPSKYKGTTITYATWRNPALYEDGPVVKEFEKKYGIKVKVDLMTEAQYTHSVLSKISAKNSPDVFFSTYTFPYCLEALQPIDAAKLNLKESIWDDALIDLATVKGKTYLVDTVGNIWKDEDMVVYNKKLFKGKTSPEDYYKAGKWNFETMQKCMQEIAAMGPDYIGGAVHLEGLIHSAGGHVIGLKNGKFFNDTKNTVTKDIMRWASNGLKDGWLSTTSIYTALNQFPTGKVGIAILHSFSLKKTGYLRNMKSSEIGFVRLPAWKGKKATATSFVRGWGICKGAKNPVAAGIFLRYYLDVNNYNTSSAFISPEAEKFFFELTSTNTKNKNFYFCYGSGVTGITGKESAVGDYISKPATADPSQVVTEIDKYQNALNADIAKLNKAMK